MIGRAAVSCGSGCGPCQDLDLCKAIPDIRLQPWAVLGNAAAIRPTFQHPLRNPTMERSLLHGQPGLEE
jgi:hypothetical protein